MIYSISLDWYVERSFISGYFHCVAEIDGRYWSASISEGALPSIELLSIQPSKPAGFKFFICEGSHRVAEAKFVARYYNLTEMTNPAYWSLVTRVNKFGKRKWIRYERLRAIS